MTERGGLLPPSLWLRTAKGVAGGPKGARHSQKRRHRPRSLMLSYFDRGCEPYLDATLGIPRDLPQRPDQAVHVLLQAHIDAKIPTSEADEGNRAILHDDAPLQQLIEYARGVQLRVLYPKQKIVGARLTNDREAI